MEESTSEPLNEPGASSDGQSQGNSTPESKTAKRVRIRQVVQTVILYIGFFSIGLAFSVVGPTLLDLQRNTSSSTEAVSFVFTARSVVGLCGAVLAGFTVDRINHWFLLSAAMAVLGPLKILQPYMVNIWALLFIFSLAGGAFAFYDAAGNMVLLKVWGDENGPWMQALHFIFGSGALIGPLLAAPFLKSKEDVTTTITPTVGTEDSTAVYQESSGLLKVVTNYTLKVVTENVSIVPLGKITEPSSGDEYESKSHWAYLIVGLMAILTSALLLGIAIFCSEIELQCLNRVKKSKTAEEKKQEEDEPEDKAFRMKMIAIVFFFYLVYCILEMNYGNYLTVFAVKGLGWSEKEGARVTAAYWATFTAGRGLGIILVKVLAPWVLLTGDLVISIVSLVVLTLFSHYHYSVLWVCTLTLGFGISTIFATGITWTEQYIRITGVAGAVFMVAGAGGEFLGPIVISSLFTSVGPRSFLYVMCSAISLLVVLFVVMEFMGRSHGKRRRPEPPADAMVLQANGTIQNETDDGGSLSNTV